MKTTLDDSKLILGLKALASRKRLNILKQLSSGEQCVCDLEECCGDQQPLTSFHLKCLRDAGLVEARREGRWMHYSIDRERLEAVGTALLDLAGSRPDRDEEGVCAESQACA